MVAYGQLHRHTIRRCRDRLLERRSKGQAFASLLAKRGDLVTQSARLNTMQLHTC